MKKGIGAFLIVLLLMPLGHAVMVLLEQLLHDHKFLGAGITGFLGLFILYIGIINRDKRALASILGLLAAVFIWTGWVEFSFVWVAEKLQVSPQMENGEVVTKAEYLVMLSSFGLLFMVVSYYLFVRSNCTFFVWIQGMFKVRDTSTSRAGEAKPLALTTYIESMVIIWFFYILLLVIYDPQIVGDRHPITYIVAYGSLAWSMYLMVKLLRIKKFDYAIRYAIPTVIIFWNFIEILGRWGWFNEFWVQPLDYALEVSIIAALTIAAIVYYLWLERHKPKPTVV